MPKEIPSPYTDRHCFFCGTDNPIGLKLRFFLDEETGEVSTDYFPSPHFSGLGNILHGGIQSGLFDEIMGWTAHHLNSQMGVTTDLRVHFSRPVYLGKPIRVSCRITSREGPRVHMEAVITQEGTVRSEAQGTYHLLTAERFGAISLGKLAGG